MYMVGKVAAVFFQNPSNFYKVLLINIEETDSDYHEKQIVVTGSFGDIQEEEEYRFFGKLVQHPKYGEQMQVDRYEKEQPTSEQGLVNYLSSDKFPGIGKKTAEKIIDLLGEEAIDRIIEDPSVLEQISSLTEKKRKLLVETIQLNYGMDKVIVGLNRYGFGSRLSFAIYQTYKNEALDIIEENPYQLVEDIEGVGFKKADVLAEQLGIEATSPRRIRAAVLHQIFQQAIQTGDTYSPAKQLMDQTIRLLETSRPVEIKPKAVADGIIQLVEEQKIAQEETNLYENSLFFSEWGIASSIQALLQQGSEKKYSKEKVKKALRKIEKKSGITYGHSQEKAISEAVQAPLFILTGGPGTGKTTVINGIVQMYAELNDCSLDPKEYTEESFPILLAAPTGRAAKRMNEMTGLPSATIHRLLGLNGREKASEMTAKELEGGLLIIDEMSMVDTWLANTLFKAIGDSMQVILVGDKDQLPSVGPGQVLHDLLQVKEIPKLELTEIYRQGDGSTIIDLAHDIKSGHTPADLTQNKKDRSFFACNASQIDPLISKVVEKAQAKGFTSQDIQVLAPMYRGAAGIDALNKSLQEIFNPNENQQQKEVRWNDTVYRIGDKVLQLVNLPEKNVFNGDMGQIVGITYAKESDDKVDELTILFDATEVQYTRNEWINITLAYCCSIHKSQGSEFKMVILPMVPQYNRMLQRNLLYTAVTRSKELLILLGDPLSYKRCIEQESNLRLTTLKKRIDGTDTLSSQMKEKIVHFEIDEQQPFEEEATTKKETSKANQTSEYKEEKTTQKVVEGKKRLTKTLITSHRIDPLIGLNGLSPYDFNKK